MKEIKSKSFTNGIVYLLKTDDGYPLEITDTFLPFYTKDAIGRQQNILTSYNVGDRTERWLIGVSCMSGCPIRCKFCATAKLKKWRNLTAHEIVEQVIFIVEKNGFKRSEGSHGSYYHIPSKEFKINYTRMGDFSLNLDNVKQAIEILDRLFCGKIHHYISTIGIKGVDYSWIKGNVTLQLSLHSLREDTRNYLIPYKNKLTIKELGQVRTESNLKTTINMTLVDEKDFDINILKECFDPQFFFIKISPLNENCISDKNGLKGIIEGKNLM